jgi:predicted membrane protein
MATKTENNNSKLVLAFALILIGVIWILRKLGLYFDINLSIPHLLFPFKNLVQSLPSFLFSWPMVLIIVGLVLFAGNRSSGVVLMIIGSIFLIPKIFAFPGLSISFLLPAILVGIGISMVLKRV